MSEDPTRQFAVGLLVGTVTVLAAMSVTVATRFVSKESAIKHGAAYYHPETGAFTWKEPAKGEVQP